MENTALAEAGDRLTGGTKIDQERRGGLEFLQSDGICGAPHEEQCARYSARRQRQHGAELLAQSEFVDLLAVLGAVQA